MCSGNWWRSAQILRRILYRHKWIHAEKYSIRADRRIKRNTRTNTQTICVYILSIGITSSRQFSPYNCCCYCRRLRLLLLLLLVLLLLCRRCHHRHHLIETYIHGSKINDDIQGNFAQLIRCYASIDIIKWIVQHPMRWMS